MVIAKTDRNAEIYDLRFDEGWTFAQIAEKFDISKTRARQIVNRMIEKKRHSREIVNISEDPNTYTFYDKTKGIVVDEFTIKR